MQTRFGYRCPFNNLEPVKSGISENAVLDEELISYAVHDNLEIPGGNTRRQIKVEVGLGYCSAEDKCLNLHEKWYLNENMVGTTIAKDQLTDTK